MAKNWTKKEAVDAFKRSAGSMRRVPGRHPNYDARWDDWVRFLADLNECGHPRAAWWSAPDFVLWPFQRHACRSTILPK